MESERATGDDVDSVEQKFLVSKLTSMINLLKADTSKQNMVLKMVTNLPNRLNDLKVALNSDTNKKESLCRINNVLNDMNSHSNKQSLFSSWSLYSFSSQIAALKSELLRRPAQNNTQPSRPNTTREITNPNPNPSNPIDKASPELSTRSPDSNAHGFDDKIRSLVRMLCLRREHDGAEFRAVGVSGIRGVGKTMLCQQVFKHPDVQSYFLPRIWVCLSRKVSEDDEGHRIVVVKRMLEALGVEEDVIRFAETRQNLQGLLYVLRLQLVGKNYLIVLDDAWKEDEEEFFSGLDKDESSSKKLAYGLPKGDGGAVLVTSRWQEMVNFMVGRDRTHSLTSTLDSESCWLIFKEEAEKDHCKLSEDLKALKDEIVKKCNGLPLSAKWLGQLARESLN